MSGTLNALFLATLAFVAGHFVLSSTPVRRRLVRLLVPWPSPLRSFG